MIHKLDNPIDHCELKFSKESKGEFEGYASVFNGVDAVGDTIIPGAFAETIKSGRTPAMFINHDSWSIPVGKWVALSEDSMGLHAKGQIDLNHKDGPSLYSALKTGAMTGLSIGFRIPSGGASDNEKGGRDISSIDLKEISAVTFPADDSARIEAVKTDDIKAITNYKNAELFLRESAGFPRSMATAFVSQLSHVSQSESEKVLKEQNTELKAIIMELRKRIGEQKCTEFTDYLVRAIKKF